MKQAISKNCFTQTYLNLNTLWTHTILKGFAEWCPSRFVGVDWKNGSYSTQNVDLIWKWPSS